MLFFFIIYTFDIQKEKYGEHEEKNKSEVPNSMIDEVKPSKKKLRTFDDKKWEAVTSELEQRKKRSPRSDESKIMTTVNSENNIDEKWEEIRNRSNWIKQSKHVSALGMKAQNKR